MNFDSLSAMSIEDRVRKMARVLEKLSADKNILDLTKIFGKKKWEKLKKRQTENPEPVANRREVDKQPCGLYNSGNFCYLNSFLQTWYNDPVFRQCIYDWRPILDFVKPENAKMNIQDVMNSIQKLFVTLQITPYEHTDAHELINLLKLTNDQQDVQEFFILFFESIHRHLEAHPSGEKIRQTILSRVEGKTKKTVSCTCGKTNVTEEGFRSVVLHINNGANTLNQLLQEHWKPKDLMSDFLCDECGKRGGTSVSSEPAVLPPVLVIQISRYTFDPATNRNKKVATAIQYPRELPETSLRSNADPNSVYELGAVMIHEGQNVSCGHYYDIIKDSKTNKWFSYNDKEVAQVKPPGVMSEKTKVPARPGPDLKGCYVLIYRRSENPLIDADTNESVSSVMFPEFRLPPSEVVQEIERKLNDSFQDKTSGESLSYKVWNECLNERFNMLEHFWSLLTVDSLKTITDLPSTVAFLPTDLLSDIQQKEYEAVNQLKDLEAVKNGTVSERQSNIDEQEYINMALEQIGEHDPDTETEEDYWQRTMEFALTIREDKQAAIIETAARIQAESNGPIDENMLKLMYVSEPLCDINMILCPHEKISVESIRRGQIKTVNRSAAEALLNKYEVGIRLKRYASASQKNGFVPDGPAKEACILMTGLKTGADLCEDCVDMMRREANFKKELDNCTKMVNEIKRRASAKGSSFEYPPSDALWISRPQLFGYKKVANNEMKYQKSLHTQKPSLLVFSSKFEGFVEGQRPLSQHNNAANEEEEDLESSPPEKKPRLSSNRIKSESCSPGKESPILINGKDSREMSPNVEMLDEKTEQVRPVCINEDLICGHGGLDGKSKKIWVHPHEWQALVVDIFQTYKEIPVTTKDCEMCSDAYNNVEMQRIDCQTKLQQIQQTIGPILKKIEKRLLTPETWDQCVQCTHVLCSKFIYKFRNALKNKSVVMPTICQDCLLCSDHQLPFQHFATGGVDDCDSLRQYDEASSGVSQTCTLPENGVTIQGVLYDPVVVGPLPITNEEWETIMSEFRIACEDFEVPTEIKLHEGAHLEFCLECESKFNQTLVQRRCDYPEGADIYVRLKGDEADTTSNENGNRSGAPTTRRLALKSLIKVKMTSKQTVRDLKLQLYRRIKQTPNDQLIYMGETLLENQQTLGEALVCGNNKNSPLTLITQQQAEVSDQPRVLEKGFCDTALAT